MGSTFGIYTQSVYNKVVKATEGSGPSRIVITLLKSFWYTLKMYKARYGMYGLVWPMWVVFGLANDL
ncbi:hypothetical protein EPI10_028366 [Gossypium australe]|uniref:Uncharacterized protein n=1 Tax=Gossypium australe TaxID=47621 RepID=A0A5B6UYD0_9ROSI|nr:hypothetical protein EPI10_028366 [Gossypium australe]